MISDFLPRNKKILFLNDRHEEADTDKEDRRKLYDKRILPFLGPKDIAIFGEKVDPFLLKYYRDLGLAKIIQENIFYESSYLNYSSLTEAVLNNNKMLKRLRERKFDLIVSYIESKNTEILAKKIGASLLRNSSFTEWINNKGNYRRVIRELNLPEIPGFESDSSKAFGHFLVLKSNGFRKILLKRERSISGFGIFAVKSEKELKACLRENFNSGERFVMEGCVEPVRLSPSFQYFISENEIKFIAATDQLFEKGGVAYLGNIFPSAALSDPEILEKINAFSRKICRYLQKKRCFGISGIDYIVDKSGGVYSTEVNARMNGSSYPALIIDKLLGKDARICWLCKTFHFKKMSFKKLFDSSDFFFKPGVGCGVLPIGVDLLETMGEGQFMIIGSTLSEIERQRASFEKTAKKIC